MNTRILMVLKVSMLLPWLLPVDRSEYVNRHITSRSLVCFKKEAEGPKNVRKGIELTASTFSENFILTPQNEPKNPKVKFTLKIFNIRIQSFEQIEIYEEGELSNFWDFNEEGRYKKGGDSQEVEISKLLGFSGEPCDGTHSEECSKRRAFKEKYGTCLQGITVDITFSRGRLDTHSPDMLQAIHVKLKGEKTGTFTSFEGDFPFELEVMSILKRELHDELINEMSQGIILSKPMLKNLEYFTEPLINHTNNLLNNKSGRDVICDILNALQDRFKSFTDSESKILRYQGFLSAISEDQRSFGHYCYEGLAKVYDPFRSTREYYLEQPEREDKRPSICSELLIAHLKSLVLQGKEMLGNLQKKLSDGMGLSTSNSRVTQAFTNSYLEILSKYVESEWGMDCLKRDTLRKTLDYFETIIQEYQGNKGESELKVNPNPLQSLDVIFKGLLRPLEDSSLFSVEDCFNCFKLDQGCVLTNYLELCFAVTGKNWDMDIQLPGPLEQQEVESLTFVKKPMLELIETFYDFLKHEINMDKPTIIRLPKRIEVNITVFLEKFRLNCAQAYYTNKPFNVLKKYMTQDDYGLPTVDKTTEEFENDAHLIFESVKENFKKIVGLQGNTNLLDNFCDDVLIQGCFDKHYEDSETLAGISTLLEKGAQSILGAVLEKLKEKRDGRRDEGDGELLKHLYAIGELIENLLTHSKSSRHLEIIQQSFERNSKEPRKNR